MTEQALPQPQPPAIQAPPVSQQAAGSSWLRAWEVFVLPILGVALLGYQAYLMQRQTDLIDSQVKISERQTSLGEQQTKLTEVQTDLARSQLSPKLRFERNKDNEFLITNLAEPVQDLTATCISFMEFPTKKGSKLIAIDGFFRTSVERAARSGTVYYYPSPNLLLWFIEATDALGRGERRVLQYVELDYFNRIGEKRTERYVVAWPTTYQTYPTDKRPLFDARFDFKAFEKEPDQKAAVEAFQRLLEKLKAE